MCMRICSLYMYHRNVHEDLPSSLFIQKSAIFEVEDQPRFYVLNCDNEAKFCCRFKNIEFIPGMKHNAEEVSEIALKFHFGSGDVMQKILLHKYTLIIIFRISSSTIIFLEPLQPTKITNSLPH